MLPSVPMLVRFSLYGFLKNQRYFEPFMVLAFLEKGLSFFAIGLLVAFREVMVNLWEIPSGAVADVCGRRGPGGAFWPVGLVGLLTCTLVLVSVVAPSHRRNNPAGESHRSEVGDRSGE